MVVRLDERSKLEKLAKQLTTRAANGLGWKLDPDEVKLLERYVRIITDQNDRAFFLLSMLDNEGPDVEGVPV